MNGQEASGKTESGKPTAGLDYSFGVFLGIVLGFIVSKVYQTWAIVYRETWFDPNRLTSWPAHNEPLWIHATENPTGFLLAVILLFGIISAAFTWAYRKTSGRS